MKIIFHTFDNPWGNTAVCTLWHIARGFRITGYHYVILNGWLGLGVYNRMFDGWLETGRPLNDDDDMDVWERGAHIRGWNRNSIGIGMVGKSGEFTNAQLYTARYLTEMLREQFFEVSVYQHSDFDIKKSWCAGLTDRQINFITGD